MNSKIEYRIAILCLIYFIIIFVSPLNSTHIAYAQQTKKSSTEYIENARILLKQASIEYKNGNYSKAEDIAASAYLDNFEYVESDLQKHGQSKLVSEIEKMMTGDLRGMIKDRVAQNQLDSEIAAIDAKLVQAIAVVPEFPLGTTVIIMSIVVGTFIVFTRLNQTRKPTL